MRSLASGAAFLLVFAALAFAQDWKTAETLPGVDGSSLTPAQKTKALKVLRDTGCTCGCSMKLAECRFVDPNCAFSTNLGKVAMDAARQGKDEAGIRAAIEASSWAHPEQPKLLEDPVRIPVGGSPSMGPDDAPITLVEFSDFQCPYCAAAVPQVRAILKAYPAQIRLVFKQFPLDIHPQANLAAAAALAAQKQGKFWPMHDAMYAGRNLSRDAILEMARNAGLDLKKFQDDLTSTGVQEAIVRDTQDGETAGVEGTPTFFINGQKYNGPLTLSVLKPVLDDQLKKPSSPVAN
jgi:protein-disulfide isomerase